MRSLVTYRASLALLCMLLALLFNGHIQQDPSHGTVASRMTLNVASMGTFLSFVQKALIISRSSPSNTVDNFWAICHKTSIQRCGWRWIGRFRSGHSVTLYATNGCATEADLIQCSPMPGGSQIELLSTSLFEDLFAMERRIGQPLRLVANLEMICPFLPLAPRHSVTLYVAKH